MTGSFAIFEMLFLFITLAHLQVVHSSSEYELIQNITARYNANVRPVYNFSDKVEVKVGLAFKQIIDMDEKNQILRSMVWMRLYWTDQNIRWNPTDFGGVSSIRMLPKTVWTPDVTLYNDVSDTGMTAMMNYPVTFYSSGSVVWLAPVQASSSCPLDMSNFPYDQQRCNFTYGSWSYHGFALDIVNRTDSGDTTSFIDTGEWQVAAMPVVRSVEYYGCCPEPYPTVTFTVVLRRRALFYVFNLLLPCVVIVAITGVGFYLPSESGEKVSLMVTIMLSLTVFLLLVAESMPPSAKSIPLIGMFFAIAIVTVAVATITSVVILHIHHSGTHNRRIPFWAKKIIFGWMASIVGKRKMVQELGYGGNNKISFFQRTETAKTDLPSESAASLPDCEKTIDTFSGSQHALGKILQNLNHLTEMMESKQADDKLVEEWQLAAMILDKFFFLLFLIFTVTMGTFIFVYSPTYD